MYTQRGSLSTRGQVEYCSLNRHWATSLPTQHPSTEQSVQTPMNTAPLTSRFTLEALPEICRHNSKVNQISIIIHSATKQSTKVIIDLFQDLFKMSQEREDEREGVESGEVELSLFARQNEDIRRLIWQAIMAPETRGLTREYDYRLHIRYPITSQINEESRAMTQTYYPDIWDREAGGMPILWPPMRFNVQTDSLYITNDRHMIDTARALGNNLSRIQSIAMPSRIIPGINIVPAHPAVPLQDYLQQWHQDHEEPFPFQTLTHCIVEDPPCNTPMAPSHRLSESGYCTYMRQAVEEFFQAEKSRHPEFRIPRVIVVPQRTGPDLCRDCIAEARRIGLGSWRGVVIRRR
ncbi:hypothetical protein OCU04_010868 [Sclerotinia nivalis]|uniref:Uncharacterized protein n=1 Tax=Sclerotinia nivalis TaxID=352851 RepID=A0A9X0AD10_9HELO|nr:hypothetical protein OCU04_010868 [Sclerotinia nivalis]